MADVIKSLRAAYQRNPDALDILSMVCGISEDRLIELVKGEGRPIDQHEQMMLEANQ